MGMVFLSILVGTCVYADGAGSVVLHWNKGDFSVEPVWDAEDYQYDLYLSRNNRGVLTNQERVDTKVWLEFQPAGKLAVAAFITVGGSTCVNSMEIWLPPQSETAFEVNLACVPDGDKPLSRLDLGTLTLTVSDGDVAVEPQQVGYSDQDVGGEKDSLPIIINRLNEESSIPDVVDADGERTGTVDGEQTGTADGEHAGMADGEDTGTADGEDTGTIDRERTGTADGEQTGTADGASDDRGMGVTVIKDRIADTVSGGDGG
jgi:hypothetical protein